MDGNRYRIQQRQSLPLAEPKLHSFFVSLCRQVILYKLMHLAFKGRCRTATARQVRDNLLDGTPETCTLEVGDKAENVAYGTAYEVCYVHQHGQLCVEYPNGSIGVYQRNRLRLVRRPPK